MKQLNRHKHTGDGLRAAQSYPVRGPAIKTNETMEKNNVAVCVCEPLSDGVA